MEFYIALHDENDVVRGCGSQFGNQDTLHHLNRAIKSIFNIDLMHQVLFYEDGQRIDGFGDDCLQSLGLQHHSKVIVKHIFLNNWTAYLEEVNSIRQLTTSGATSTRKSYAIRGLQQLSLLDDSDFFVVYPHLVGKRILIDREINFLVHNTAKYLERSVKKYFEAYEVEIDKKPKSLPGAQLGFFVKVTDKTSGLCRKFYAKTVGPTPRVEFPSGVEPRIDLIELFVYQLLSLIGLGASEVHIVPDTTKSGCVYLATSLIPGFCMASGHVVEELLTNPNASEKDLVICEEVQNQAKIIASILALIDLIGNRSNYGVVERQPTNEESQTGVDGPVHKRSRWPRSQELRIVDFRVDSTRGPRTPKTTTTTSLESYFDKWRLKENISKAKQLIMENEAIKNTNNVNLPQFELYVKQIEENLQSLHN